MRLKNDDPTQGQIPTELLSQNRHESYLRTYLKWLDKVSPDDPAARRIMVIARSPESPVICAIQAKATDLSARQVAVQAIFSDVDPERALRLAWETIGELSEGRAHCDLVKWASSPGILEAHEQLILGREMCWLGDAMRREPGRRDGFDIFETDAAQKCAIAIKSFDALWRFASDVPGWMLREPEQRRSSGSLAGPDPRALATLSFFRQLDKPDTLFH